MALRQLLKLAFIGFILLHWPGTLCAQTYLIVPVNLETELGEVSGVSVKVTKDGKAAFTQSGSSWMQFRLELNCRYELTFSKASHVTRKISFDTRVPPGQGRDEFNPFPIGVRLLRQQEGGKVILKQSPTEIHFDEQLGEFATKKDQPVQTFIHQSSPVSANNNVTTSAGDDRKPKSLQAIGEEVKITREDKHEKRKIVTTVRVIRNGVAVEYRRVTHDWGGVYYFRNGTTCIPENLFMEWTGVRL